MATKIEAALFEGIVREHADMLSTYIRTLSRDALSREEIFQETIAVAWRRLGSYDPSRAMGPWLRGIARKTALGKARERGAHLSLDEAGFARVEASFAALARQPGDTFEEKLECLRTCMEGLSDRERDALRVRYEDGLRGTPLARRIGVEVENAKKIVQRARARLLSCMERRLSVGEAS